MIHNKTPLLDALLFHIGKDPVSFHVPGHKYGTLFPEIGRDYYQSILSLDVTELTGLDDLHAPEGPIREAQDLLAGLYNTRESFFLVNGTTSGNLAMILAALNEGDDVLVQRNCHKSILHGLMLANANPIFISPSYEEDWEIASGLSLEKIEEALNLYPNTKAIILTYPNYYGIGEDIAPIIQLAHKKKIAVLVDEAHGAHFVLEGSFPPSAVTLGADIVVQSAHKTLPAMTMGSFLHYNSDIIESDKLRFYLQMFQSSSPSYPIMASLDLARYYLASYTGKDIDTLTEGIHLLKEGLKDIKGIRVLNSKGSISDPLKMTLRSTEGYSGFELQSALEKNSIFTELADPLNVLLVLPLNGELIISNIELVLNRIRKSINHLKGKRKITSAPIAFTSIKPIPLELTFKEMNTKSKVAVNLKDSIGLIAAEAIIPYPPGIPLFLSGEKIEEERISHLETYISMGSRFHGGNRLKEGKIIVFK